MIPDSTSLKDFWVVVTDMDGTLLDHHSYSFDQALPALNELRRLNIPLVFNTSKTRMELRTFAVSLGVTSPMVVENGGGIFIPQQVTSHAFWCETDFFPEGGQWITLGIPRSDIQEALDFIRRRRDLPFRTFAEMSLSELQQITGLSEKAAKDARERDFSEPLFWEGSDSALNWLRSALREHGLQMSKGGRFYTVSGRHDKGNALHWLRSYFGFGSDRKVRLVALGDGPNDLPMLEAADLAIAVRSPVNSPLESDQQTLHPTVSTGPQGWNESMLGWLHQLGLSGNVTTTEQQPLSIE